ncbi:murein L,D-transpeptidase catalytic domain-containing protein [Shimia aestuarii]|uniref:murein L,D-transpeptidase catalytic domain-containing protein n=1 Tax=Shimia aestuarii TaxID=254406 RepID=UPI001FB42590|nr:murein L,D-transpeptidase catalytic domain family protein [Shimia aestuarii]
MPSTARRSALAALAALCVGLPGAVAANPAPVPAWLQTHVGVGEGKIASVVLHRARDLYQKKRAQGSVRNACYFAMDATRPSTGQDGKAGRRFYIICEDSRTFRAISSGYGNGRKLHRANFSNGRECAQNFSNAEGSKLTAGGAYVTAETRTSFKGVIHEDGAKTPFYRTFILFDGEGETQNARERAIGGHRAAFVRWQCRFEDPENPHADDEGYVPFGRLIDYTSGRSNGCTTWSEDHSQEIISLVEGNPTTLYIYPESGDIDAVARTVSKKATLAGSGLYWNTACLEKIGAPQFWPKQRLQPIINTWRQSLPKQPPRVLPICD